MAFAPAYLVWRFIYRFIDAFHHWYVDGSRAIGHRFVETLATADRSLAIKETARHFFQPLYRDYTAVGRVLGVIFRTGRILVGVVVYAVVAVFFALFYLAWLALPAALIFYAATGR